MRTEITVSSLRDYTHLRSQLLKDFNFFDSTLFEFEILASFLLSSSNDWLNFHLILYLKYPLDFQNCHREIITGPQTCICMQKNHFR